jgi:hypothetical protein
MHPGSGVPSGAIELNCLEAGGIPPLVALLAALPESEAAQRAADALLHLVLAHDPDGVGATVLDAVAAADPAPPVAAFPRLQWQLRRFAARQLLAAAARDDGALAALRTALALAEAVGVEGGGLEHGRARVTEWAEAGRRQARREALGVGRLAPIPADES